MTDQQERTDYQQFDWAALRRNLEERDERLSGWTADRARIAELEAERDAAKQWATELQGRQRHHIARIEHLEAALREYGDHTQTCDWRAPSAYPFACSCGWESTRRALTTSTQEPGTYRPPPLVRPGPTASTVEEPPREP